MNVVSLASDDGLKEVNEWCPFHAVISKSQQKQVTQNLFLRLSFTLEQRDVAMHASDDHITCAITLKKNNQ